MSSVVEEMSAAQPQLARVALESHVFPVPSHPANLLSQPSSPLPSDTTAHTLSPAILNTPTSTLPPSTTADSLYSSIPPYGVPSTRHATPLPVLSRSTAYTLLSPRLPHASSHNFSAPLPLCDVPSPYHPTPPPLPSTYPSPNDYPLPLPFGRSSFDSLWCPRRPPSLTASSPTAH